MSVDPLLLFRECVQTLLIFHKSILPNWLYFIMQATKALSVKYDKHSKLCGRLRPVCFKSALITPQRHDSNIYFVCIRSYRDLFHNGLFIYSILNTFDLRRNKVREPAKHRTFAVSCATQPVVASNCKQTGRNTGRAGPQERRAAGKNARMVHFGVLCHKT